MPVRMARKARSRSEASRRTSESIQSTSDPARPTDGATETSGRTRPLRVVGYIRVSTEEQGANGYGLDAQRDEIERYCEVRGYHLVTVTSDVVSTRKIDEMYGRAVVVAGIQANIADALVVRAFDRITRSTLDGAQLLDQAKRQGWHILGIDGTDTRDKGQRMTNRVRMIMAEEERDKISERTKEGLARARRNGVQLGRPSKIAPTLARRIVRMRKTEGLSAQKIAAHLTAKKVPAPGGGATWHHSTVRSVLAREGVA